MGGTTKTDIHLQQMLSTPAINAKKYGMQSHEDTPVRPVSPVWPVAPGVPACPKGCWLCYVGSHPTPLSKSGA